MLDLRVSDKGCISIYGLRRFPITLYVEEFEKILENEGEIHDFIVRNESRLSRKNKKVPSVVVS